jgi:hypothetical protein
MNPELSPATIAIYRSSRPPCLPGVFTDFLAAFFAGAFLTAFFAAFFAGAFLAAAFFAAVFLAGDFLAVFFAGAFLAAFFATAFFTAFFAGAFFAAFFATIFFATFFTAFLVGALFAAPVSAATVESNAVLMALAASSAAAIPNPTAYAAFSVIVSSAIPRPSDAYVYTPLKISEIYLCRHISALLPLLVLPFLPSFAPRSFCQRFPHQGTEKPFDSARACAFSAASTPTERK